MKILAIRLKNLASIEGSYEIDFTSEPLASAGIFAISGPTGAGKSTILDALCLALYDKTPRFVATGESLYLHDVGDSQVNQNDVKNILRRGAGEGFAEVVFMGVDGHRYQSRWFVRRARSKPTGALQSQTMQVADLDAEKELQGTKTELLNQLVALIGLTYEQFTRTVLLAQNDFATFLKSRESSKAELLEKLTGTEIYSQISRVVYNRTKTAVDSLNLLKSSAGLIKLLPEEELRLLQKNRDELLIKRTEATGKLNELTDKLKLIQSLNRQQELLTAKQGEEIVAKTDLEKQHALLNQQTEALAEFKEQCEKLQPDLRKARELDIQMQGAQTSCNQAEQACRSSRQKRTDIVVDASGTEQEQLINNERSRKLNSFDIRALGEEQTALVQKQKKLQEDRRKTSDWLKRQQDAEQLTIQLTEKKALSERMQKEYSTVHEAYIVKQAEQKTLQGVYDNLRIAVGKDVQALRNALIEGKECPVCGSTGHPYVGAAEAVESHYRRVEKDYYAVQEEFRQINNRSISLQRDMKNLEQGKEQQQKQLAVVLQEIEQNKPLTAEQQTIHYFDSQLEGLHSKLEVLSGKLREYQQLYDEWLWYDYKIKESNLNVLREQRQLLLKGKSVDDAEASIQRREKELTHTFETIRKNVDNANARVSSIQGEIKQLIKVVDELKKEKEQIESPDNLPDTIAKQQVVKEEVENKLSAVEAHLLQQKESRARLKEIEAELKEKQSVAEQWEKLNKLIGSADGSKFKVIAQSYTLNLLLMHANKHLSYLSKRYRLQQVPDTLALQVIDCDMCDEVRTVYSLSGGESFLISLALALGLSSLSGNNLKVESLFIDEGFGSLDTESLRLAMDALEQLQMQGRKIGVISHVQEMSERIPVQVQVNKLVNGRSSIEVVG